MSIKLLRCWQGLSLVSVIIVYLSVCLVDGQTGGRTIQVGHANVIGTTENIEGRTAYIFKGIPYADAGRWEEPVLRTPQGTIRAIDYGERCPQLNAAGLGVTGSENCLTLNVYTIHLPAQSSTSGATGRPLRPVMVYIHGGGFMAGSSISAGHRRFMKQDVVLVTINYRLGLLGFLSTGDSVIPGNYGLLDQIKALEWVRENIRYFGGNAHSVTIFGDSAGAAAVNLLMLSNRARSKPLFHRAILQSGSALCDWAVEPNPREYADQIAEALECSGDSEYMKSCLKEKTPEEIVQAHNATLKTWVFPLRAAPVVDAGWRDDEVLSDTPANLMSSGAFAQIPVIAGVNQDEGLAAYVIAHLEHGVDNFGNQEYFEQTVIPTFVQSAFHAESNEAVMQAVRKQYFEGVNISTPEGLRSAISEFVELISDSLFNSCNYNLLETLASNLNSKAYSYVFSHKTEFSPSVVRNKINQLENAGVRHPLFKNGVSHSDELHYLFNPLTLYTASTFDPLNNRDDRAQSDMLVRTWVGFARDGNTSQAWRPISVGDINYYNLSSGTMGSEFRKGDSLFWLRTVPYISELGDTIDSLSIYPILFYIFLGLFILFLIIAIVLGVLLHKKRTSQKVVM